MVTDTKVAYDSLQTTLQLLQEYESITGTLGRWVDLSHSALLQRLALKQPIYKYPPPKAMSYPWYRLLDEGEEARCEVIPESVWAWFPGKTVVNQCGDWDLKELISDREIVVSWPHYKLIVHLERLDTNFVFYNWTAKILETENVAVDNAWETVKLKTVTP